MRKMILTAAVALSAVAVTAPAAAHYRGQPYGNAYGYNNNWGQVRALQNRVNYAQREIRNLDRRNILSNREARRLMNEANSIEYRLRRASRNGLSWSEHRNISVRIQRLQQHIIREATDGNRRFGYGAYRYPDRDRDGLDDRYERDHGTRHDRR